MNVKHISAKKQKGRTDWCKVGLMADEEIDLAATSDPDAPLLTKNELKQFKRVNPTKEVDVKLIRQKLHLSQDEFASYFGVSVRTIQEWEQHRRNPTATARNFLKVIELAPQVVLRALKSN
jgi:DNA-binding transcriptional regulator YiaG